MMRSKFKILSFLFLSALLTTTIAQAQDRVVLPPPKSDSDVRYQYDHDLLELALKETRDLFGGYSIDYAPMIMSTKRSRREVVTGRLINVMRSPTDDKLEHEALPIRIPILRGLLGYRIMMIRKQDQAVFSQIDSLKDLKHLSLGQGTGWNDIPILEANGLKVVKSPTYKGLFTMLSKRRFDYFPRGVNEILPELEVNLPDNPDLAAERELMLYYPFPVYFFVSKKTPELAARIELGLWRLQERGAIQELLDIYFKKNIEALQLNKRRLLKLENPFLPAETPIDNRKLWFDPVG